MAKQYEQSYAKTFKAGKHAKKKARRNYTPGVKPEPRRGPRGRR